MMNTRSFFNARDKSAARWWALTLAALLPACQTESTGLNASIAAYRDQMLTRHQQAAATAEERTPGAQRRPTVRPVAAQVALPERAALLTEPAIESPPSPAEVLAEFPDSARAAEVFDRRLEELRRSQADRQDQRLVRNYERVVARAKDYLARAALPRQVPLSLSGCIQRAIENNYTIRAEAHSPAIAQAQIVEAEAAFDVEFFLDTSWADSDRATISPFIAGSDDQRIYGGGLRQLLPTGTQASVSLNQNRLQNSLPAEFQTLNPAYSSSFVASLRQPLLRGFGLDVNRATINIRKIEHEISYETFIQRVRDTLLEVENAYWQLAQARRTVTILAVSVAQNLVTYENMKQRLDHDATQVEVSNSEARWLSAEVNYLDAVKTIRDAEDRLLNLLNDPELKLSEELELVTSQTPFVAPLILDHFAEVRTALERRSEIRQAKQNIERARINSTVAKNLTLPKLDVSFEYEVQGIGRSADSSFDNLTTARFMSYTMGASFSYNFGERAARAQLRQARLQESQGVVWLNQQSDTIVEEVNQTIRTLMVRFEQIGPALKAVQAAGKNLRSLQARTQRIDPNYLQTELGAVEQLASTRTTLLRLVTEYNVGLVQLEKAKGTLLDYNNVVVADVQPGR